jgi:hypothetical protein
VWRFAGTKLRSEGIGGSMRAALTTAVVTTLLVTGSASAAEVGKVFQSHSPDGSAYLVVLCLQADECFEYAYQFCEGPYVPLDKQFRPMEGFRFVCRKSPHKKKPAVDDPQAVRPQG